MQRTSSATLSTFWIRQQFTPAWGGGTIHHILQERSVNLHVCMYLFQSTMAWYLEGLTLISVASHTLPNAPVHAGGHKWSQLNYISGKKQRYNSEVIKLNTSRFLRLSMQISNRICDSNPMETSNDKRVYWLLSSPSITFLPSFHQSWPNSKFNIQMSSVFLWYLTWPCKYPAASLTKGKSSVLLTQLCTLRALRWRCGDAVKSRAFLRQELLRLFPRVMVHSNHGLPAKEKQNHLNIYHRPQTVWSMSASHSH